MNLGNSRTINSSRSTSGATSATACELPSRTPIGVLRARKISCSAFQRSNGTTTGPSGGSGSAAPTCCHGSAISSPFLSRGIDALLERRDTDAAIRVEETLAIAAQGQIGLDER